MLTEHFTLSLADMIADALTRYGYSERDTIEHERDTAFYFIMTPRKRMVRYLCVVSELPEKVKDQAGCLAYFEYVRSLLFRKYAKFPWFKELGTYSVFVCQNELYDQLSSANEFKDRTGLHGNVMLGTCFVETMNFRNSTDSTWGLYYSGEHFGAISEAVRQWCSQRKPEAIDDAG